MSYWEARAYAYMGSDDFAFINDNLVNGSDPFVTKLLQRGTKVILRLGTHDETKPFVHMSQYIAALVEAGVPLRVELGHRFGHGFALGTQPDERALLNRVIDGDLALSTGLFHFHPNTVQDELDFVGNAFSPPHAPVFLEAPMWLSLGQQSTLSITGPPGAEYQIWGAHIDLVEWLGGNIVDISPPPGPAFSGTLPGAIAGVEMTSAVHSLMLPYSPSSGGPWRFEVRYRLSNGDPWTVIAGDTSMPLSSTTSTPAASYVAAEDLLVQLFDIAPVSFFEDKGIADEVKGLVVSSRVGGLSEDSDF